MAIKKDRELDILTFALNFVQEAIFLTDEQAHIKYVNIESCKLLRYTQHELLELDVSAIDPEFPKDLWPAHWNELRESKSLVFKSHHKTKTGVIFPVEVCANYFEFDGVGYNLALVRDISERLKTEELNQLNNNRYRMSQSIGHIGNWEYNVDTGQFWGSDEAKRIYGFNPDDETFSTQEVENCIPERECVHQALIDLIEKRKPYNLEFEIIPKNTTIHRIISSIAELRKEEPGGQLKVVGVIQDITDRKKDEKKSEQLAALVESSEDAIISKSLDGIITSWNKSAERMFGYSEDEILGKPISILYPSGSEYELQNILRRIQSGDHIQNIESVRRTKDGIEIYVSLSISPIYDKHGKIIAASTIAHDITERKINEAINSSRMNLIQFSINHSLDELLEETLNETEKITNSHISFYHFVDDDQINLTLQNWSHGTKTDFCQAEGKWLHYPISEAGVWVDCVYQRKPVIHNNYSSLPNKKGMPKGHAEVVRELVVPVIRGEKIVAILGVGNKPTDYDEKDINTVNLFADLAWDIAQRKQVEEEISMLNQSLEKRVQERTTQLETVNKELEAFAYSVSHDLRAPLRHINGFLELLENKIKDKLDESSQHYLSVIYESSHQMNTLIDDLLSFSRMGRNEMLSINVNLNELVKDVIREFEPDIKNRKISWKIADLPVVKGDKAMLRIVFYNLISNSIKFTQPRENAEIEIGIEPSSKEEYVFFIRDNGVGFDMKLVDKLFGVFQRLHQKEDFEGTGIGLANVRLIITRHGGRTWAEGEVDHGATFYFSLQQDKMEISNDDY